MCSSVPAPVRVGSGNLFSGKSACRASATPSSVRGACDWRTVPVARPNSFAPMNDSMRFARCASLSPLRPFLPFIVTNRFYPQRIPLPPCELLDTCGEKLTEGCLPRLPLAPAAAAARRLNEKNAIKKCQNLIQALFFNGIPVNDPENGWTIWSYWGGLNDVTRYPENKFGISSSSATFGSIGGYSYISALPSEKKTGTRISYAATNRSYRNRLMYSYNTGLNEKGWDY